LQVLSPGRLLTPPRSSYMFSKLSRRSAEAWRAVHT
jgi:hypothetical protein